MAVSLTKQSAVLGGQIAAYATRTKVPSALIERRPQRGHARPLPITFDLNQPGRIRVGHWLTLLQISHASFYARLRSGKLPPPDGRDGKRSYWNNKTVREFLDA